jgi:hypothetical protein
VRTRRLGDRHPKTEGAPGDLAPGGRGGVHPKIKVPWGKDFGIERYSGKDLK